MGFTLEKKTTDAQFPRTAGATSLSNDRLKIVYDRYKTDTPIPDGVTKVNFIFAHGSGMNKSVWSYHCKKLYELTQNFSNWRVDSIVSVDGATHGDSALLNKEKMGWTCDWCDGGRDLIQVVKHECNTSGDFTPGVDTRNILVGHSMGGFNALYAGFLEPNLFDSIVAAEPVIHYDAAFTGPFFKRIKKVGTLIKEEFPDMEAARHYYKHESFYKTLHPEVLNDFVEDSVFQDTDGKIKLKANKQAALATYYSVAHSGFRGMHCLLMLDMPFYHITGSDATWTPPMSVEFINEQVPKHLLETTEVEKGQHNLHAEMPDTFLDLVIKFADKRVKFIRSRKDNFPEVKYNNDREQIVRNLSKQLEVPDLETCFYYGHVRAKL